MVRFVTLANRSYWCGLFALMQSIRENGQMPESTEFVVIHEEAVSPEIAAALADTGFRIELVDRRELGDVSSKHRQLQPRLEYAMRKLLVLRLDQYEKLALIDTDMICLNSLQGIERLDHFCAAPDRGTSDPPRIAGQPMFNTGFVVYRPSRELFDQLLTYIDESTRQMNEFGDQSVLNWFMYERHPESVRLLDSSWNKLKRVATHFPEQFDLGSIRLLHYVGRNPWEPALRHPGEWPFLPMTRLWWRYFLRSPGARVLTMPHGPPPQPAIPLLRSFHAIYRGIRRIPRAARLAKELAGEGIEGARKLADAMDGHQVDRPMDRSRQGTATEARKVELDRSLAPWVLELALGDRASADERLQAAIRQGEFTREQIRHLSATLRVNGRPDLAKRLLANESGQSVEAISLSGRDGRLAAHPMLRLPLILPRMARAENRGLLGRAVRLQFGQRRAETSYRAVRGQLHDRLAGKRVLLLGSGPTAADVTHVPDDVIVVAVNRAPTRLAQIGSVGAGWLWALCLTMGRDHWAHAQRIAATLPPPSHTLLEFHAGKRLLGTWNACHWEQVMARGWRVDNPQYIATNDDRVLDHTGFDHAPFVGAHLSLGVTMLRHILAAGPDEVFLAGIDLGQGSPTEPHRTYFHTADEFTHDDGSPLVSRQQYVHIFDQLYMQALSRWSFPIVTVSEESRVAQFFPVKPLDPINQPDREPRAA